MLFINHSFPNKKKYIKHTKKSKQAKFLEAIKPEGLEIKEYFPASHKNNFLRKYFLFFYCF